MGRLIRIEVDREGLTDELFDFVTDPSATRIDRPVIRELRDFAPGIVYVMENMVIDGVDARHYVAEYIDAVFDRDEDAELYTP